MRRYERRISFVLGSLLLLILTVGALLWAILTAYAPPVLHCPLLGAAALCALLAWAMGLLPRFRWLAALGYLTAWGFLLWRKWDLVCYGALIMLRQVTRTLAETFSIPVVGPAEAVTAAQEALAATWWLGMVLAVWALLLGWITARRRCWWATVLLTLPPLLPAVLSGVMPAWGSLVVLAAVWLALLLQSSVRRTAAAGRQMLLTLPAALAALALLTALLPRAEYVHPAWTAGARSWVLTRFTGLQDALSQGGGASGEAVNLAAAGPLRRSGRTMLHVESDLSGHFLLRGSAFGIYTGTSWENDDGADFPEGEDNILFAPGNRRFHGLIGSSRYDMEDLAGMQSMEITPVGDRGIYAYCPYQPVGPVEDLLAADRDIGVLSLGEEDSYPVFFIPLLGDQLFVGERVPPYPYTSYVADHYLDVPEELEDLLWEVLAPGVDGEIVPERPSDVSDEVYLYLGSADVVAQCLAAWAEYDPDTPRPSAGEDFVEHFLTERRGYCMHFASAGALMLRLLGIPARYVTGYSVDIPESGTLDVSDAAAHAWVEIYLAEYGWYPVEMTPGYGGEEETETVTPEGPEETPEDPGETAPEMPETPETPEETAPEAEPLSIPPAVWGTVLALLALTAWHFGLAALRRRKLRQSDPNRAVIAAYRSMERMRAWGGELDPRLTELGGKARFSQHTLTEEERAEAIARLEETAKALEARLSWWRRMAFRWLWGR